MTICSALFAGLAGALSASANAEELTSAQRAPLSSDIFAMLAQERIGAPPRPKQEMPASVTMVLDTSINGTATGRLLTFRCDADGTFSARAKELRALRIKIDDGISDDAQVPLSSLAGLSFRYDEARQAIELLVPDALLEPFAIALGGERDATDLSRVKPLNGFLLNYGLYAATGAGHSYLSGNVEAVAMTDIGLFTATGLFNSKGIYGRRRFGDDGGHAVRLDSSWRVIDPVKVRSYTIGDFVSGALDWTSSVRLAGLQIQSAFKQRGDLITSAMPQFSGSAALPSTLDLYVNNMKVFTGQVPAGPFELRSLPYMSGGDVRIVTTDATGRQVEMTKSYYYAPGLLKHGLTEFSLDLGVPRYDYGRASFHYDDAVYGSASVRHGIGRRTTIEGHIEGASDGLVNGGAGIVQSIGGIGAISASAAASSYKGDTGAKFKVQADFNLRGVRGFIGTERTTGVYFDLARLSLLKDARRHDRLSSEPDDYADWLDRTARATSIDRAGISFRPSFDRTSISVSYNRIKSEGIGRDGRDSLRTINASASRGLSDGVNLFVSGFADVDDSRNYGLFATLNVRIGRRVTATAGVERNGGRTGYTTQLTGSAGQRQGEVNWSISNREYDHGNAWRSATLGYRSGIADVRGQIDESGGKWRGSAQVEGSIIAAGGDVFPASRIGQAFAVVRGAGPNTPIRQGGALMAKANGNGNALLPELSPWAETIISIDPTNLPRGWEPLTTELTAAAPYRRGTVVDFGTRRVHGAIIALVDSEGEALKPGYVARLEGAIINESDYAAPGIGIVGYDGEVYIRGLSAQNRLIVDLGAEGTCNASFAYDLEGGPQPKIGPVVCR